MLVSGYSKVRHNPKPPVGPTTPPSIHTSGHGPRSATSTPLEPLLLHPASFPSPPPSPPPPRRRRHRCRRHAEPPPPHRRGGPGGGPARPAAAPRARLRTRLRDGGGGGGPAAGDGSQEAGGDHGDGAGLSVRERRRRLLRPPARRGERHRPHRSLRRLQVPHPLRRPDPGVLIRGIHRRQERPPPRRLPPVLHRQRQEGARVCRDRPRLQAHGKGSYHWKQISCCYLKIKMPHLF